MWSSWILEVVRCMLVIERIAISHKPLPNICQMNVQPKKRYHSHNFSRHDKCLRRDYKPGLEMPQLGNKFCNHSTNLEHSNRPSLSTTSSHIPSLPYLRIRNAATDPESRGKRTALNRYNRYKVMFFKTMQRDVIDLYR